MDLVRFWADRRAETMVLLQQHLVLVLVSTIVAIAVGVPLGVLAARRRRLGRVVLGAASVAQTIPSLALLGFLLPLPLVGGLGSRTALVTLAIYAVLPIVRTTATGLMNVDRSAVEAGVAMGMTRRQLLWMVEMPLALPTIVSGVRIATVIGVGTATIAAAIGAGGLGEYIFRGLAMVDTTTILGGAIPAAALALVADAALGWMERRLNRVRATPPVAPLLAAVAVFATAGVLAATRATEDVVVVGSKNFTEQVILGELVAQTLEADAGVRVVRKLNLGGTFVCDRALRAGDLDIYIEYTGTAVAAVFHEAVPPEPGRALARARELYARSGVTLLGPLGFNNTFTILVRGSDARALKLETVDDLRAVASRWTAGFGYEFLQRDDGFAGLARTYGLAFAAPPRGMDLSLIYRALSEGSVDVIAGDATSAQIEALDLEPLEDRRQYFPPYEAVPLVRTATLLRHPAVGRALETLAGRVTDRDMRSLNAAVDIAKEDPRMAVERFRESVGSR
jgi:osmoprotectant transport system permease protein